MLLPLAAELEVNPNTVAKACREMELTGVIATAGCNGTVFTSAQKAVARPFATSCQDADSRHCTKC